MKLVTVFLAELMYVYHSYINYMLSKSVITGTINFRRCNMYSVINKCIRILCL